MLRDIDTERLLDALASGTMAPQLLAFALALSLPFWRGARLRRLVPRALAAPRGALTRIAAEVLLWSFVLPFKLGELSFPWLLNRRLGLPVGETVAIFLLIRFTDLAAMVGLTALALAATGWTPIAHLEWALVAGGLVLLASPYGVIALAARVRGRAKGTLGNLLAGAAHARSAGAMLWMLMTTLGLWFTHAAIVWLVLGAHDLDIGVAWSVVTSTASNLAFALPLPSVLGLGPQQVAFTSVAEIAQAPPAASVAAAFGTYVVLAAAAILCGLIARASSSASADTALQRRNRPSL